MLALMGICFGYYFIFVGGTWLSILVGLMIVAFTSYLVWNYVTYG